MPAFNEFVWRFVNGVARTVVAARAAAFARSCY